MIISRSTGWQIIIFRWQMQESWEVAEDRTTSLLQLLLRTNCLIKPGCDCRILTHRFSVRRCAILEDEVKKYFESPWLEVNVLSKKPHTLWFQISAFFQPNSWLLQRRYLFSMGLFPKHHHLNSPACSNTLSILARWIFWYLHTSPVPSFL